MGFSDFFDWWMDNIACCGMNLADWILDAVEDFAGEAAAMGALALLLPVLAPLAVLGMVSTFIPIAATVLWLPVALVIGVVRRVNNKSA